MKKSFILIVLSSLWIAFNISSIRAEGISLPGTSACSYLLLNPYIQLKDTLPKVSLLKKLTDFLKFKKNMRGAERQRMLDVIHNTFFADSIMANAREIRMLNAALKDTVNQKFDSLVSLISDLQLSDNALKNSLAGDTAGLENDTAISQEDINQLINKILPLIRQKSNENKGTTNNGLAILKDIRYYYGRTRKKTDDVTVKGIGDLRLERKAPVYTFYPSDMEDNYLDYNMGIINTLIYDGYDLDGQTGKCWNTGDTDTSMAIKNAERAGCKVLLAIHGDDAHNVALFLKDQYHQRQAFIGSVMYLLRIHGANGIDIDFTKMDKLYRTEFVHFIRGLNDSMRMNVPQCHLIITIPSGDNNVAFDLNELNAPNIKFLIDFSSVSSNMPMGPIAHLEGGDNGIEPTVSRYLNSNLSPGKFIICLPYYGTKWRVNPVNGKGHFVQYLSVNDILSQYKEPTLYDPKTRAAFIDLTDSQGQMTGKIWYNDTKTLNTIYDFILQNGLGGIAVRPMRTKIGFSHLWAGIGNKFLHVDTLSHLGRRINALYVRQRMLTSLDSIRKEPFSASWKKVKTYDSLVAKILFFFERPCKTDFIVGQTALMAIKDTTSIPRIIASKVQFFRVRRVTKAFLAGINTLLLIIFIVVGYIYVDKLRKKGKSWAFRKAIGLIMILLACSLILFTFIYLFLSDLIPGFGAIYGEAHKCYRIPLQIPLIIVILGMLFGVLIMRYLIFPLLKKDDIP